MVTNLTTDGVLEPNMSPKRERAVSFTYTPGLPPQDPQLKPSWIIILDLIPGHNPVRELTYGDNTVEKHLIPASADWTSASTWLYKITTTVPTFNSCTECVGNPGTINDRTSDHHPVCWPWMHG